MQTLLCGLPQATDLLGKWEQYAHRDARKSRGDVFRRREGGRQIGDGTRHGALLAVGEGNHQGRCIAPGRRGGGERKRVPIEGMRRVNNGDLRHYSIMEWGILMTLGNR
jgi:hypothetical protein